MIWFVEVIKKYGGNAKMVRCSNYEILQNLTHYVNLEGIKWYSTEKSYCQDEQSNA